MQLAAENKDKKVVFFATGFETTIPAVAGTLFEAERIGLDNFYIYSAHKIVPPALKALLGFPDLKIDGFILPGHVSAIIGTKPYEFIASDYKIASAVTGFEADDILTCIMMLLEQIASRRAQVEIQYSRVVKKEGNQKAVALMDEYFEPCDANWRGIGVMGRVCGEANPEVAAPRSLTLQNQGDKLANCPEHGWFSPFFGPSTDRNSAG